jgi:hypothetical protein
MPRAIQRPIEWTNPNPHSSDRQCTPCWHTKGPPPRMVGHLKHTVPPLSPTTAALSARSSISLPREFLARQAGLQVSHPAPHRRLEPQILRDGRRAVPRRVWGGTAHHGAGQLDARHAHAVELEAVWLPRTLPCLSAHTYPPLGAAAVCALDPIHNQRRPPCTNVPHHLEGGRLGWRRKSNTIGRD